MAIEKVHAALPNSRIVMLEGQGHAATMRAPELLASEVLPIITVRPSR